VRPLVALALVFASNAACAPAPPAPAPPAPPPIATSSVPAPPPAASSVGEPPVAPREPPCSRDADCGFDPVAVRCGNDPRLVRLPPLVDQGPSCFCDEARRACALLRALPVPCEGDGDCAVDPSPRPHPVRATAARPHERGKRCRDYAIATTCERTNLCTMHPLECPR
jgi:hypothetical protein